ncbi:MAG: toprim domain-containing protein [Cyclobacteriaceae bacterium]
MSTDFTSLKSKINLPEYAAFHGYEIKREKTTRHSIAMRKGSEDKIIISKRSGIWIYFSVYDDQDHGTIIDFVQNRTGKIIPEIVQELRSWISADIQISHVRHSTINIKEKKAEPERIKRLFGLCRRVSANSYLAGRGISPQALQCPRFSGRVFQDRFNNAVFPHFKDGQVCGLELKGENTGLFVRGSKKTLWRSNIKSSDNTLMIAETPIDAMSYQILHELKTAFYVATGGGFSAAQGKLISELTNKPSSIKNIKLITDNDKGGDALALKLLAVIRKSKYDGKLARDSPAIRGQDWNDVLCEKLGL